MNFVLYLLATLVLLVLWTLRPWFMALVNIVVFYFEELIHKKEADRIVKLLNKLDDEDIIQAIKPYRRRFLGLKLFNIVFLIVYAWFSAIIVYLFIPAYWLYSLVFFGTLVLNWSFFVTNSTIRYLVFHEGRMTQREARATDADVEKTTLEITEAEEAQVDEDDLKSWEDIKKESKS